MDLTIITPNLNYGRFLEDCLQSVASQRGVGLEHIVMDGGSEDESEEIVRNYPHATWCQRNDTGMSQAINRGFDQAKGCWVMWLNADDRLKPNVLRSVLDQLEACEEDVGFGDFDFVDERGSFSRSVKLPRWSPFVHVYHHCYVASTAAFYRRRSVIEAGYRLNEELCYVMDGEFYIRLHEEGMRFKHIGLNISDFRLHEGNASMKHLGRPKNFDAALEMERQHVESRAIRRMYGFTLSKDPYLNGMIDGVLWVAAKVWKGVLKSMTPRQ